MPEAHTEFPFTVEREQKYEGRLVFKRELEQPAYSLAIDKVPHVAALRSKEIAVHTAKGWRSEKLPPRAEREPRGTRRAIFYGRDYRVRLVVNAFSDAGVDSYYWRLMESGFRPQPDELGPLSLPLRSLPSSARAGSVENYVVALLGTEDPEVVCRRFDLCLIKRNSGWARVPSPPEPRLLAIRGGNAWGVFDHDLMQLERDKSWKTLGRGAWAKADDLLVTDGAIWIVETDAQRLWRFDGQRFDEVASPVGAPHAIWGAAATALWLGGEDGLAHFDGQAWRRVGELAGPVYDVLGRSEDDVWLAAEAGLFHGQPHE